MRSDRTPPRRVTYEKGTRIGGSGWFGRLLAIVLSVIVLVAAAMLSVLLLTVLFAVGTIIVVLSLVEARHHHPYSLQISAINSIKIERSHNSNRPSASTPRGFTAFSSRWSETRNQVVQASK
jgi:hypothetical protein